MTYGFFSRSLFFFAKEKTVHSHRMLDTKLALSTAMDAAKKAGDFLVSRYNDIHVRGEAIAIREKGSALDLVTDIDRDSQRMIVETIHQVFPDHRFLGEEGETDAIGSPASPYTWIIDPLDGTTCFLHGRTNFGTIIALQENDVIQLGVISIPLKNQLFHGTRGGGAFCNGQPLKLRNTRDMADAILCSNTIRRAEKCVRGELHVSIPFCASLENYGSAVEEFGEILLGHNDGGFFRGPRLWDIAAGCFLIEELGGKAKYTFEEPGNPRGGLLVAASTAPIFDELSHFVFTTLAKSPTPEK